MKHHARQVLWYGTAIAAWSFGMLTILAYSLVVFYLGIQTVLSPTQAALASTFLLFGFPFAFALLTLGCIYIRWTLAHGPLIGHAGD